MHLKLEAIVLDEENTIRVHTSTGIPFSATRARYWLERSFHPLRSVNEDEFTISWTGGIGIKPIRKSRARKSPRSLRPFPSGSGSVKRSG